MVSTQTGKKHRLLYYFILEIIFLLLINRAMREHIIQVVLEIIWEHMPIFA